MRYWYDTEFIEDGITIELLSIGIVAEDGREYYAEHANADLSKASDWVKTHVFPHLTNTAYSREVIRRGILAFMDIEEYGTPELWGYYSAYDHVAFCQLFGTMMDLPKGYPMYTRDLKQWCDMLGNPTLPEQEVSEHHALADARWNRLIWQILSEKHP